MSDKDLEAMEMLAPCSLEQRGFTRDIRPNKNPTNHSSSKSNHWFFRIYLQTYPTTSKSRNPTAVGFTFNAIEE